MHKIYFFFLFLYFTVMLFTYFHSQIHATIYILLHLLQNWYVVTDLALDIILSEKRVSYGKRISLGHTVMTFTIITTIFASSRDPFEARWKKPVKELKLPLFFLSTMFQLHIEQYQRTGYKNKLNLSYVAKILCKVFALILYTKLRICELTQRYIIVPVSTFISAIFI